MTLGATLTAARSATTPTPATARHFANDGFYRVLTSSPTSNPSVITAASSSEHAALDTDDRETPARHGRHDPFLDVIHVLALEILKEHTLDDLLWLVAKSVISKLGFEDCVIYLHDETRGVLVQRAAFGPKSPEGEQILNPIEIPVGAGIVGTCASLREPQLVEDVRDDPRYIVDDASRCSELAVPIVCRDQLLGVIDSEHAEPGFYSRQDLEILTIIASMASTKIDAAMTIERLNETVSQLERTRNALRAEEQRYRDLYHRHPSMFFSVDADGTVISINDYACQQLGYDREALEGCPLVQLVEREAATDVHTELTRTLAEPEQVRRWDCPVRDSSGEALWLRMTARAMVEDDRPVVLIVSEDVTEARVLSQELEFHAAHDWLTGLINRREFERRLEQAAPPPGAGDAEHALCFIDLDRFKIVNDTCGHAAGDALLRKVASLLSEQTRSTDVVARLGGDEFGVLMLHCDLPRAARVAEQLLQAMSASPFTWEGKRFELGASIGVAPLGGPSAEVAELLSIADAACGTAKESGRNRVHIYRESDVDIARRRGESRWVSQLVAALEEDRFELWGQPIVALHDDCDSPGHTEVLLRLVTEDGERVSPNVFMATAERFDLASRIDRWVIDKAIARLASTPRLGDCLDRWAINLSGASIANDGFLEGVIRHIQATGIDPERLSFEITETAAVADLQRAQRFILELKALGCRFAIDDFGSGLSSLAYLKTLPVDYLKIDGVFIEDVNADPVSRAMVRSINDIGQLTDKWTVAEFVSDDAILSAVRELGVHYAQGFAIALPRPLDELADARDPE